MHLLAVAAFLSQPVTFSSLVDEMTDLNRLTFPAAYTAAQASSYDRKSVSLGGADWFANGDFGQFDRQEGNEHVMADLKGPGAVLRIWSANPSGTIRMYFDGETKPRVEAPMADFLSGKGVFKDPYAYVAARGYNLYAPLPYSKSLKITGEGPDMARLYYQIGYRTYPEGTSVETFNLDFAKQTAKPRNLDRPVRPIGSSAQGTMSLKVKGKGVVQEFKIEFPKAYKFTPETFAQMNLRVTIDGKDTVYLPLANYFATPTSPKAYESQALSVSLPGTFTSRFPMPYEKEVKVQLVTRTRMLVPATVTIQYQEVEVVPPLRFVATFGYDEQPSRPMRDLNMLFSEGPGRFVGMSLQVENPVTGWWGEGDEKVWVDNELFPSTFGTGTEDYFGYAWCDPTPFARPYHGQPRADGPANFGHVSNFRWQTFDDIPFKKHLKFAIEAWHWIDCDSRWRWVTYHYVDASHVPAVTAPKIFIPRKLVLPEPKVEKGALEGEALKVLSVSGGTTEIQGGFEGLSKGQQLWWKGPKESDELVLEVKVPSSRKYRVQMNLCHAVDYGRMSMSLGGLSLGEHEFYCPELKWKTLDFGTHSLKAGVNQLRVKVGKTHPQAIPSNMFGLDWIKLIPE